MILKKLEVGPIAANCYIVGCETSKEGIIIDPGAEAGRILETVKELGLDIKFIVLTHGHMDHIGAAKEVKRATGAEIAIHTNEAKSLQGWSLSNPADASSTSAPDRLIKGGDSIDIGDLHFLVIHTPGHSSGGICLLGHGVVFSGDTLFNYGIGRYDLPGSSGSQLANSLYTKLMVLPDDTIVYPGHGPDTTIGTERRGNPFLQNL